MGWVTDKGSIPQFKEGGKVKKWAKKEPKIEGIGPLKRKQLQDKAKRPGARWETEISKQRERQGPKSKNEKDWRKKYEEGGKVNKELDYIRELGKDVEIIKKGKDKGKYKVTGRFDVPTSVVGGEGGGKRRQYEGVGVSKDLGFAASKAEFLAQDKMAFSPEDSLITTGKKKKLGKLKKRRKK